MKKVYASVVILLLSLSFLFLSACSTLKSMQDKHAHKYYATRFEFENRGSVEVISHRDMKYDNRKANFAEIFANAMREEMEKRDLTVSTLIPTKGGFYLLDEIKGQRDFMLSVVMLQGRMLLNYVIPDGSSHFYGAIPYEEFGEFVNSYDSDENFYAGAKDEFRPLINEMLDAAFNKAKFLSFTDF